MSQISQGTLTHAVPLPLTHPIYHIMLVLATGERHGYGLKREIALSTDGRMRVGNGSLYRSLDVMLTAGLIGETRGAFDADPAQLRLFCLTSLGERIARTETERLAHLVTVARRVPRLWDDPAPGALLVSPISLTPTSHPPHSAYGREDS